MILLMIPGFVMLIGGAAAIPMLGDAGGAIAAGGFMLMILAAGAN